MDYKQILNAWEERKHLISMVPIECIIELGYNISLNKDETVLDLCCGYGEMLNLLEVLDMKIIFVRHGKDDDNYRGGWSKLDLVTEGIEQAKKLAKHLRENNDIYKVTKIISSDLPRTKTTAEFISVELGLPVFTNYDLREMNNGDLAGMLNSEALIKYPGLFFSTLRMDERYPKGESPIEFYTRIKTWFEDFIKYKHDIDGNVLIVTHSGVINIIYHLVKNLEWSNQCHSFKVDNCSVHVLNVDNMEFEVENRTDFLLN